VEKAFGERVEEVVFVAFDLEDETEEDVPHEPAAYGNYPCPSGDYGLVVHFQDQHFGVDEHHGGGKAELAHAEKIVVFGEQRSTEQAPHGEVDNSSFRGSEEHPGEVFGDIETAVVLAFGIELRDCEKS